MSPEEDRPRGLTRERLVEAALQLINQEGLEALSMRALADRLEVKAASLYWHVRDRRELLELLAESILDGVGRPRRGAGWRQGVMATSEALRRRVSAQKDADRILLEVPGSLARSDGFRTITTHLQSAGLQAGEAADVAMMVMTLGIASRSPEEAVAFDRTGASASIAVDSGSRGVILRAGPPDVQALIRVPPGQSGAAPTVVRGEQVVVRRLRGVGRGVIELNPRRSWKFKVQGPTWNTVLDVGGLDVREIHVDSGAANLECFLPEPRGAIPIRISSGVVNVSLHRPRGTALVAHVHTGALKLKLDGVATRVAVFDVHWQSEGALEAKDRFDLDVSSGVVDLKLDTYAPKVERAGAAVAEPVQAGKPASALDILLDGVEAHVKARTS